MNQLTTKDWVCLVDDATLQAKQTAMRERAARSNAMPTPLREMLWRQITITARADTVRLDLMNVDQEAAAGGYWRGGEAPRTHTFTWDDLQDMELIDNLLAREQVAVYRRALSMLTTLKARVGVLREALTAL